MHQVNLFCLSSIAVIFPAILFYFIDIFYIFHISILFSLDSVWFFLWDAASLVLHVIVAFYLELYLLSLPFLSSFIS